MKPSHLIAAVAAFVFAVGIFAQPSDAAKACATFTIKVQAGDGAAFFSVEPAKEGLTYNWSVSAGTIQSGQGTSSIMVATTGMPAGEDVTATVEIGGLKPSCSKQSILSASTKVP